MTERSSLSSEVLLTLIRAANQIRKRDLKAVWSQYLIDYGILELEEALVRSLENLHLSMQRVFSGLVEVSD